MPLHINEWRKLSARDSNYKHRCVECWSTTKLNTKTVLSYPISKWPNELNRQFSKENKQVTNRLPKMCSTFFLSHQQM